MERLIEEQHHQEYKQHQDHQEKENTDGKVIQERDQNYNLQAIMERRNPSQCYIHDHSGKKGFPSKVTNKNLLESPQPDIYHKDLPPSWAPILRIGWR